MIMLRLVVLVAVHPDRETTSRRDNVVAHDRSKRVFGYTSERIFFCEERSAVR